MDAALEARGLCFGYGDVPVWEDVSFSLEPGQVAFLTGPNGAGKSTLFRCLAGWLVPTAGEVLLGGYQYSGRTRLAPGELVFVSDVPSFYDDLTAIEHIELVLSVNRADDARPRAEELLERFGLMGHERLLPSAFSRGMREKLALVLALMLRPRVLLLDEPHGPLDREASLTLSEELSKVAGEGTAVLLSCHHDVPGLASDVLLELADGVLSVRTGA
ncbi:ABC transporter ATP-binding protein [Olsenella profusa]|uniref:ABC transporter ATP-binding protein n=1 Tax=Olsenella profusa TaxID=138595 RepID=A0ABS2EZG3_9ACTN|nr:ABC transporter ATP-binding protein [Olsenella profusa]MBM6774022.1 ABC transporter ATP-binding protein [Olsenella profusa]